MNKIIFVILVLLIIIGSGFFLRRENTGANPQNNTNVLNNFAEEFAVSPEQVDLHPLTIESLRKGQYPGSDLVIEQTLEDGPNYQRYIASYKSEGLKIYGLLTVPKGGVEGGWPAIIFNHGYIPPKEYKTTERYAGYLDGFARSGYVVFKPDYRGHGNSEGDSVGAYGSNAYTADVLNALGSVKKLKDVDSQRIGMWGHSLGGFLTLRSMVVSKDIKVGVIWAGVVGSYPDLINNWRRGFSPPPTLPSGARRWRQVLIEQYGTPGQNPSFWASLSANTYLSGISGPLQLHHGISDSSVPFDFSEKLYSDLKSLGKEAEYYSYPGDDHNITNNFSTALKRSVEFFDKYLKN